jgi:hypothetical protein
MHEYHFSLNEKYKNTHFSLNDEQVGLLTHTTHYIAPTPNYTWRGENSPLQVRKWERRGLGMLCLYSNPRPPLFIGQEELLGCLGHHQWGGDTWCWGVGAKLVYLSWEGVAGTPPPPGIFGQAPRITFSSSWQDDMWKGGTRGKVGSAELWGQLISG